MELFCSGDDIGLDHNPKTPIKFISARVISGINPGCPVFQGLKTIRQSRPLARGQSTRRRRLRMPENEEDMSKNPEHMSRHAQIISQEDEKG
jgi:hypothetical protein